MVRDGPDDGQAAAIDGTDAAQVDSPALVASLRLFLLFAQSQQN